MSQELWIVLITSLMSSSAVFGFIQFLISRKDKNKEILESIQNQIQKLTEHLRVDIEEVYEQINGLSDTVDKIQAVNARVRILQAADGIRLGRQHSKEFFDQLSEDITMYENYCKDNPKFQNNKAVQAIEYVNTVYQDYMRNDSFL